ncbi:ribosomal protein large subunit L3 [Thermoplasma volcanium GSS1]|uniref:Large ribosomal subunit protein uL3 n=1 Tax=Thermoplasma volcanium (strain ATCC 51530 / DSM 4299 / JCM 9571 / NBRC 15438 / GSS1) TaxID=273116 RepID=RL3_THEVO|nr:50S ribosomal protein L3 [Thermoplasma volcanium]Q97BX7.1 RecName: Full=Large ribosomal subunit protein uL3; AltName: Full=50S ribosomal protein L3 [Thermoplasma volcanium GSS1]BAB59470.1 ribosomal protein large subunit L3 [Thermoplasma volcanium GSS1]
MATPHHSRRGSMAYYPRVRAKSIEPRIRSWPEISGPVKVQGFAGFKVGMTHVEMVDYRKTSVTAGQPIFVPVTVIEVPPLDVIGIRLYDEDEEGNMVVVYEKWTQNLDKELFKKITTFKEVKEKPVPETYADVRLIVATRNKDVPGIPSKKPEIFELRIGGGNSVKERFEYATAHLGKTIRFEDFSKPGKFVDVLSVTKGKGFTGHVQRFGVKLLPRKNRKHRRMIGTLGPWHPDWVRNTVPQAGQMGYQQRTISNVRVLKYSKGEDADTINVRGGFLHYGLVKNDYVLLFGSVPGPAKRLIKMRDPARQKVPDIDNVKLDYISLESKQGD